MAGLAVEIEMALACLEQVDGVGGYLWEDAVAKAIRSLLKCELERQRMDRAATESEEEHWRPFRDLTTAQ